MAESRGTINLTVLGLDIAFRPGADMERARKAARLVEERFADQKLRSRGTQAKDVLLTFIVLGLADEILQMKNKEERERQSLQKLLENIDRSLREI